MFDYKIELLERSLVRLKEEVNKAEAENLHPDLIKSLKAMIELNSININRFKAAQAMRSLVEKAVKDAVSYALQLPENRDIIQLSGAFDKFPYNQTAESVSRDSIRNLDEGYFFIGS
jgi:hypothetical protein